MAASGEAVFAVSGQQVYKHLGRRPNALSVCLLMWLCESVSECVCVWGHRASKKKLRSILNKFDKHLEKSQTLHANLS